MDESRIDQLISNLDNDLILSELDGLMGEIDVDFDSISQKAHWKMRKGQREMKYRKRKAAAVAVASLVAVCGITTAYASEISSFIQSLTGKTGVYSTVVDGSAYYLQAPLALGDGQSLTSAMMAGNELELRIKADPKNRPEVKAVLGGKEVSPDGFMGEEDGMSLFFYEVAPATQFDLIVGEKTYPVTLAASSSIVGDGEIFEAEANGIGWISMGGKRTENGVQLLTSFADDGVELVSLVVPQKDRVTQSYHGNSGHTNREELQPLSGRAANGKTQEYRYDPNDMGRPLTVFTPASPVTGPISIEVPGIVVTNGKKTTLDVALPAIGEEKALSQTVDLGLQKMTLKGVKRTSATTASVTFDLNTGNQEEVRIWHAILRPGAGSAELLWENGVCTVNASFDQSEDSLKLSLDDPQFIVDGNWVINLK